MPIGAQESWYLAGGKHNFLVTQSGVNYYCILNIIRDIRLSNIFNVYTTYVYLWKKNMYFVGVFLPGCTYLWWCNYIGGVDVCQSLIRRLYGRRK